VDVASTIVERNFEQVSFYTDPSTGYVAIVAIHSSVLGPALGGCRMIAYPSTESALTDVLRLAEGMTYKNSLAGLNLGGGKSVIVAPRDLKPGREELFARFGAFIQSLGGRYITAEDMGTSVTDMNAVLTNCKYVAGRDQSVGGGGDPSPWTALGVFVGMRACLERVFGSGDFAGKHVVIQGVGHVGAYLAEHLANAGARLSLSDTKEDVLAEACRKFGAQALAPELVCSTQCDVYSPCAVGAVLNDRTIPLLGAKIVAGAANNQLLNESDELLLNQKGILYAPDFAINAGGVILCADEFEPGGFTPSRVEERVRRIYSTVGRVLDEARSKGERSGVVAVRLAKERIAEVKSQASMRSPAVAAH